MMDHRSAVRKKEAIASLSFLLLIVSSIMTITSGEMPMETMQRTLPAYAIAVNAETTLNSSACSRELGVFRDAVDGRKLWAFKVLDSSGAPLPGYVYGNNYWVGRQSQCFDAANRKPLLINQEFLRNASKFRKAEDEFPPYKLNFFAAHFRHNGTVQYHVRMANEDLIALGLCLPASCTTDQLSSILKMIFQERTLMIGKLYGADFKLENVKDLRNDGTWFINAGMITVTFVLVITVFLMIAATAYDVLIYQKYLRNKRAISDTCNNNNSNDQKLTVETTDSGIPAKIKPSGIFGDVLKCFSIYTNTKLIFDTKLETDVVGVITGLRFLGMLWIIMAHSVYYMSDVMDNATWTFRVSDGFIAQLISNSLLAVDSFFFMSGFLTSYLHFKNNLNKNTDDDSINYKAKMSEFFNRIWKRFVRLTPAYMMAIGIIEIVSAWFDETSVFYMTERPQELCSKYWWRNLLYINNFFSHEEMCLSWSWYLSNDMQFFVIGNFLLILSSVYFNAAVTILGLILVSSSILGGYISYIHGFVPTLDEYLIKLDVVYNPPWMRIGPYIVGIVAAYIVVRLNNKLTIRRINIVALWVLGSACNLVALFGLYKRHISVIYTAFYIPISRVIWGIGLGWILIACTTNHAGLVKTFLTFRAWIPMSKLCYSAYLLNPLIMNMVYLKSESSSHLDVLPTLTMIFGIIVLTYACSYVYTLMMEAPYVQIVRVLTKPRKQ